MNTFICNLFIFCYSDENEMNFHKCKKNLPCVKSELANN
jgi:hypothetical protein